MFAPQHSEEHLGHSQTRSARKAKQGSNYGGHRVNGLHKESRKNSVSKKALVSTADPAQNLESSFKAPIPRRFMEPPPQEQTPLQPQEAKGTVGIVNIGNTCYMNSALQAIRNNTELTAFFLENKHESYFQEKQETCAMRITKAYIDVLRHLWGGSKPQVLNPQGFFNDLSWAVNGTHYEQFQRRIPHDSHEFLMYLLDSFHTSLAEEVNIVITRPPPVTESDQMIYKALEFWRSSFQKTYSPLVDALFGLFQREMACQHCKKSTYSWEVFNCLKVYYPETQNGVVPTLESLLQEEFKDETIEGYACDHCAPTRTTAIRKTRLWKLPRTLIVALKRFSLTGQKLAGPFTLNPSEPVKFDSFFSSFSPEPSRQKQYSLYATIDHFGSSGGGHYTAQALSPLNQKWYHYDDDSVSEIQEPSIGRSTYILCFKS